MQKVVDLNFRPDLRNWTFLDQLKSKETFYISLMSRNDDIRSLIYIELMVASYSRKIHKYLFLNLKIKIENMFSSIKYVNSQNYICHEYEVLDLFSCGLVKPQVVTTTTTIKPKPENDQKGEFCFLFICITL